MQYYYCFKAVYYMLTDIRFNNSTFSRLPTILGGDFAQILPVVPQGNRVAIISACLQRSFLWPTFRILFLQLNMRVYQGKINQHFTIQVQSLSYNIFMAGRVNILSSIAQFQSKELFYRHIYPPQLLMQACYNLYTFCDYVILIVYNNTVVQINKAVLIQLYSPLTIFYFTDFIEQNREENYIKLLLVELLQTFNPNSLPLLELSLKVGAHVILLQNLSPKEGLCNSTRMVVIYIGRHYIKTRILSSRFNSQVRLIPYIKFMSIERELPFIISKRQFLIQLCFAITVNKS